MKRGEFLKLSCTGCMLCAAGLLSVAELLSCAPGGMKILRASREGTGLSLPASSVADGKVHIVQGRGLDYDIALRLTVENDYEALLLRCTHFSNPLVQAGDGYACSLHGSQFDAHGAVKKGPAAVPLKKLPCKREGDNIIIIV